MSRYADRTRSIPLASLSMRQMEAMERSAFTRALNTHLDEPDGCSECQGWRDLPCAYCGLGDSSLTDELAHPSESGA